MTESQKLVDMRQPFSESYFAAQVASVVRKSNAYLRFKHKLAYLEYRKPRQASQAVSALASGSILSGRGPHQVRVTRFRGVDAQELVARKQALISGANVMRDTLGQATRKVVLNSIEAQLYVASLQNSSDFYTSKLGFAVAFIYGDPPYYGQVVRDSARFNLRLVCEPVFAGDIRKRENLLSASITVATTEELKQLFLDYQAAGVSFHQPFKQEPWGANTFVVSDPDENLILFAGPAD